MRQPHDLVAAPALRSPHDVVTAAFIFFGRRDHAPIDLHAQAGRRSHQLRPEEHLCLVGRAAGHAVGLRRPDQRGQHLSLALHLQLQRRQLPFLGRHHRRAAAHRQPDQRRQRPGDAARRGRTTSRGAIRASCTTTSTASPSATSATTAPRTSTMPPPSPSTARPWPPARAPAPSITAPSATF